MKFVAEPQVFGNGPNGGLGIVGKLGGRLPELIAHLVFVGRHSITVKKGVAQRPF